MVQSTYMSEKYDFVAIGDIVIDAFIELNKDAADVSQGYGHRETNSPHAVW